MCWIEDEIGVAPGLGAYATCKETGTPYVEIVWDPRGYLWESKYEVPDLVAARFPTPEMAWMAFAYGLDQYRKGRSGRLHWRCRPELCSSERLVHTETSGKKELLDPGGYFIYARLVIDPEVRHA